MRKRLLIVAHAPSRNTERLRDAVVAGARAPEIENVDVEAMNPFAATPNDVLAAQAVILGTTENLGYMSGALKDFFDRCYYPLLERTRACLTRFTFAPAMTEPERGAASRRSSPACAGARSASR